MDALRRSLEIVKNDPGTVYLLNLAFQQLGSPDPASLEIPPSLIYDAEVYKRGNNDFPRFLNVATPLKVDAPSLAGGSVTDDFNNGKFYYYNAY